jgi:hypothetical protein
LQLPFHASNYAYRKNTDLFPVCVLTDTFAGARRYSEAVRLLLFAAAVVLAGCSPPPAPLEKPRPDPASEIWYGQAVEQVSSMSREARRLFQQAKFDEAGAIITKGQPIENRILSVPHPTLAAMEAASELDEIYARMLERNKQYGYARLFYQKIATRWKYWRPQTADTEHRRKKAESQIAECDRLISE